MKTTHNVYRISGLAVVLVTVFASYSQAIVLDYWRFEEPEGSPPSAQPALDSAGPYPGILQANTSRSPIVFGASVPSTGAANTQSMLFADTPGEQSGAAVDMRGTDPLNPNANPDRGLGNFTIEAWINRSGDNSDKYANIAGKFPSGPLGDTGWALYARVIPEATTHYEVALLSRLDGGDFRVATSSVFLDLGTWYHVAGVRDGGEFRIYVDGVLRGTAAVAATEDYTAPMQSFSIGGARSGTSPVLTANFNGYIDEVRLSDTALAPDQFLNGPLAVGIPGDYDNSGTVDAADYVMYRKGGTLQNDPNPGNPTAQYAQFRANFGKQLGAGISVAAAVPEPGSALLALLGCVCLSCSPRVARF